MLTILNTSIATGRGVNTWESGLGLDYVREFVAPKSNRQLQLFNSAIGHQATAEILTELLGVPVAVNRQAFAQQMGDCAIVFKVHGRIPEGAILSRAELEVTGYDFGMLARPFPQLSGGNRYLWEPRLQRGEDIWCLRATNEIRDEWRNFKRERRCALWEWAEYGSGGTDYYHPTWTTTNEI